MIFFRSDYSLGAHPAVMEALERTNLTHTDGYGEDAHCYRAAALIREKIEDASADVHFFVGGTPANYTAITAFLRPHEGVIAARTSHIYKHETGSIEARGHKIIAVPTDDGKLTPAQIELALTEHEDEHTVKPKLVYISDSTEIGSIYRKDDLAAIKKICDRHGLYLYLDGARLGCALTAAGNDLTLPDIARLTDVFYIGGTKNGALFGEALVITNPALKPEFRYITKQQAGLLAKGRLLGVQFEALFTDDLYFKIASHSNQMANLLRDGIAGGGYRFLTDSPTNQIFPILPNVLVEALEKKYFFYRWQPIDERSTCIRLVTSWGTTEEEVMAFLRDL